MRDVQHGPGQATGVTAAGRLVLCPTPIGNLRDITLRALDELRAADVVLAEDTRHTAVLLRHHGVAAQLLSFHEHNERERLPAVRAMLAVGRRLVAVSDAGTPGLADPGYRLVQAALEVGAEVTALPGPSALLPALLLSGLPVHAFAFYGFLPRPSAWRDAEVRTALERPLTAVWYETALRLPASLGRLCALGYGERPAAVAREISKLHEEVARGSLATLAERYRQEAPRGELVLCVGAAQPPAVTPLDLTAAVAEVAGLRAAGMALPRAVTQVAQAHGLPRRALYAAVVHPETR